MFHLAAGILYFDVGKGMRTALFANQHGITLGKVTCLIRLATDVDQPAVGILAPAS